jgi:predicted enzyme related to lactoylglutathione lyase
MDRVVHFELAADRPERAVKFYQDVFGWKISKWEGPVDYWLVTTGEDTEPGINGAIKYRVESDQHTVNTVEVASVDECLQSIANAGGEVVMPKTKIPGVGFHAYCKDTEGNIFGLIESGASE